MKLRDKTSEFCYGKNVEIETRNNVTNLYESLGYCQHIVNFSRKCQNLLLILEVVLFKDITKKTRNMATKLYKYCNLYCIFFEMPRLASHLKGYFIS